MKRERRDRRVLLAGIGGVVAGSFLAGGRTQAGSLNPPGPPSPSMRSLDEVEPRTPIDTLPPGGGAMHVVSQGGSYKLTGKLSVPAGTLAIRITTSDPVSIDLAGFAIQGSGGGGGGAGGGAIRVETASPGPGCAYLEVFDGYIRDVDGDGINGGSARVLECYDLHIDHAMRGIVANGSLIVEACHIERCSSHGIEHQMASAETTVSFVDESECRACQGNGITVRGDLSVGAGGTFSITDTDVVENAGDGLQLEVLGAQPGWQLGHLHGSVQDVRAASNGGTGIRMTAAPSPLGTPTLVVQCEDVVSTGNSAGMHLSNVTTDLIDCVSSRNAGDGFLLEGSSGAVDACSAVQNGGDGVHVTGPSRMSVSEVASQLNGAAGIHLDLGVIHSAVQDNDVANEAVGIRVQSPGNLVVRNTALGNGTDYDVNPGTPVVIVPLAQLASNTNPHANYSS